MTSDDHYSQRLTQGGSFLTRFAHQRRMSLCVDMLGDHYFDRVLDFGCGDGWFLNESHNAGLLQKGYGIDVDPDMIDAAQKLNQGESALNFATIGNVIEADMVGSFDLAVCMETLEHVGPRLPVLETIYRWLKPEGFLLISVPIEVGPSLAAKQMGRWLANRKGQYGYSTYNWSELLSGSLNWNVATLDSDHKRGESSTGHRGFDFRKLEEELNSLFCPVKKLYSPLPFTNKWLNSTFFWLGQKK